jgi:hypothetical protein
MDSSTHIHLSDLHGYTLTAISLCHARITLTLEGFLDKTYLICTHAIIFYLSMDSLSLLRVSSADRRIDQIRTVLFGQELLLFVSLTGRIYLTICAESFSLQSGTGVRSAAVDE